MSGGGSFSGINWVKFALLDDTGKLIADATKGLGTDGVYLADQDAEGATTANITGLEEKGVIDYANNKSKRVKHGAQTPVVALTMLDINFKYLQMMKGYVSDGKGGYVLSSKKKPHVAMIICSSDYSGNNIYDCFANGEVIEVAHNHGTNNASETDYNATLEYDVLTPIDDNIFVDDNGVQRAYKNYFASDAGFDEAAMMKEVFGGYVANTGSTGTTTTTTTGK